jgi:hypothetical protein
MLTRAQQILLKRAQHDAGIDDADYREALRTIASVNSSKDPKLTDEHLDKLLGYFEAIFWRKVNQANADHAARVSKVFQRPGYWASKNTKAENSRDRFATVVMKQDIASLERQLGELGCGLGYCAAIARNAHLDLSDPQDLAKYRYALGRSLAAKRKKMEATI